MRRQGHLRQAIFDLGTSENVGDLRKDLGVNIRRGNYGLIVQQKRVDWMYYCAMPTDPIQTSLFPVEPIAKDETADKKRLDADPVEELLDPTSEQTKLLYQLAVYIQQMAPWNFMVETDVFGFQDPVSEEPGFISVMGQLGEYLPWFLTEDEAHISFTL